MAEVGYATLGIIPSFDGFARKLDSGTSRAMTAAGTSGGTVFGNAAGKTAGSRFGTVFKNAARAGLVGVGALGVGAFQIGKDAITEASDLGESLNAVNVTFEDMAKGVKRLGREAAESVGLSQTEFQGLAVQFSSFANTISKGSGKGVVRTLDDLTTRGADFASVMNLDVNEAMALFQSGLAGETEPLRRYGLDLSAAKVEAFALAEGIAKGKDELTESEKVQARYALLMRDTAKTQGDFANTADSAANRQRILNARWKDGQAQLGRGLLPIFEDFVGFVLEDGIPTFNRFSRWFNREGIPAIREFGGFLRDDVAPPLKTAAGFAEDLVGWLQKLPKNVSMGGVLGAGALVGGAKLRGGGGGVLGTAGSALGLTKPVPVMVMNKGFTAGGKGGGGTTAVAGGSDDRRTSTKWSKNLAGGALAALPLLPWAIDETQAGIAEVRREWEGMDVQVRRTTERMDALPNLLVGPLAEGGAKIKDTDNKVKQLGDTWVHTTNQTHNHLARLLTGPLQTLPGRVDKGTVAADGLRRKLNGLPPRVDTRVTVSGADRAKAQVDDLAGALADLAGAASRGIDAAGATVLDATRGTNRNRRRNIGGVGW